MTLFQYISLFFAALGGGTLAFYFKKNNAQVLRLVLSFGGAYLLGVVFLHLLPETYEGGGASIGFWILGGFLFQIFIDQFTQGVEHGHIHAHQGSSWQFAGGIIAGLSLHALMEGLPLHSFATHQGHPHGELLFGILMHKPPEAFALTLLLLTSGFERRRIVAVLLGFALMTPLGALLGLWIEQNQFFSTNITVYIMAAVIGSFFHIATTILYENESSAQHKVSWDRLLSIIFGIFCASLTMH
jgi:zinc transporter ZupT